jgi:hypothetical protein
MEEIEITSGSGIQKIILSGEACILDRGHHIISHSGEITINGIQSSGLVDVLAGGIVLFECNPKLCGTCTWKLNIPSRRIEIRVESRAMIYVSPTPTIDIGISIFR